ncbi:Imm6 family immunity protein [Melghirimyces algeriensis]|uniref:Immunity protein Imm6 n=1 Tax=Melghirimyces algeriensis TaxID=910412 RepID=A0A521C0X6_9BACL|nr:Imm6 family immunity protein [Melghirimyces algeriensis]SMO52360.1 Immunity protein Imm6 [Melghirimyces algeriensis]
MIEWKNIGTDKQVAFYLGLSETVIPFLHKSEFYLDARQALDLCWEWFETKQVSGDEIYTLLDDGTEFGGLFMQMQMDEDQTNETTWECIVSAVSFVDYQAYVYEGERFLPALIENVDAVDDELIHYFLECYVSMDQGNRKRANDFFHYLKGSGVKEKNDVMSFFSDL